MPYQQPTLTDLFTGGLNDIVSSNVTQGKSLLPRSILRRLVWMFSNLVWGNYDYLSWCYLQAVPWTATDENLDAWGALRGVTRKDATAAVLTLSSAGGTPNTDLPPGTVIARADGVTYATTADASTDATGTVTCAVQCDQTGTIGNCDAGSGFTLQTAIPGIVASFASTGTVTTAADVETDDEFRTRVLQAYATPEGGGRPSDYVRWATDTPGVTRAWCLPNGVGTGTVVLYTMFDDAEAANGGFPQGTNGAMTDDARYTTATGDQLTVANQVGVDQPVTALIISCAPTPSPINIQIDIPLTAAQQSAGQTALANLYLDEGTPLGMTLARSAIGNALTSAGLAGFDIVSPAFPLAIPVGSLPTTGTLVGAS
jgi:uncharacterized phage protein gp47/JayE